MRGRQLMMALAMEYLYQTCWAGTEGATRGSFRNLVGSTIIGRKTGYVIAYARMYAAGLRPDLGPSLLVYIHEVGAQD